MGRKAGTEVGVNSCLVAVIATESVSIAVWWLLLPPSRHRKSVSIDTAKTKTIGTSSDGTTTL